MKLVLISLSAAALSACAPMMNQPSGAMASNGMAPGARQCFRSHDIRNHTVADPRTMYLDIGGRETWRVAMSGACLAGAITSDPIVTREPPGSSMVCSPIDLDLAISRSGGIATPCIIESLTRLTPAEVAALPPKMRP